MNRESAGNNCGQDRSLITYLKSAAFRSSRMISHWVIRLTRWGGSSASLTNQGRTAIYKYAAVGNILAIRRADATGPVDTTFVNLQHYVHCCGGFSPPPVGAVLFNASDEFGGLTENVHWHRSLVSMYNHGRPTLV